MATLQNYIDQVRLLVHDTNSADFTDATLIQFINQARTRVAMDTHCVRGFLSVTGGSALNTIGGQENYSYSGTVGGVTVTNGGTNYVNPSITFTNAAGDTGTGAAASAVVTSGVITAINMTNWGQGYGKAPTVNIVGGGGSGATATSTVLANILDILSITVIWGQERIMHGFLPFSAFQTWCRQLTNQESVPSIFTLHQGVLQAFLFQVPDSAYTMEWDILTLPTALVANTDVDSQVIAPWNDAVQLFAAHLCMASLQLFQQADYWYTGKKQSPGKYDSRIMQLPATAFSRRVFNPYRTYAKRLRRM
jgi:hypothetical protein